MLKKITCYIMILFSSSLLFTTFLFPIKYELKEENKKINIKNFKNNVFEDRIEIQTKLETYIEKFKRLEKIKEENKKKELLLIKKKKENLKEKREYHDFVLTFYGLLKKECGKIDGITASNKKIKKGMVASPKNIPFGTEIVIENEKYVVEDRGDKKYIKVNNDGSIRLDVYVPRNQDENDDEYDKRIQSYGVKRVNGYILKK